MKVGIVYKSVHHGNTKKVLDAIAAQHEVDLIEVGQVDAYDLTQFDLLGLASGIYYSKFHKTVLDFAERALPEHQKVFLLYTAGVLKDGFLKSMETRIEGKSGQILGRFGCLGFDTFGPLKWIGGIHKNRPNEEDCASAIAFYESMIDAAR